MLQVYAEISLPMLAGPSGLIEHPDTVDDMFRLCARYNMNGHLQYEWPGTILIVSKWLLIECICLLHTQVPSTLPSCVLIESCCSNRPPMCFSCHYSEP